MPQDSMFSPLASVSAADGLALEVPSVDCVDVEEVPSVVDVGAEVVGEAGEVVVVVAMLVLTVVVFVVPDVWLCTLEAQAKPRRAGNRRAPHVSESQRCPRKDAAFRIAALLRPEIRRV
jgi:hypothetical protein